MTGHPHDLPLDQARALVQRAVDKAEQLGLRGGIAVVGASGALVTASRLDHGGPGGMARAVSKAWISATQQIPSTEHLHRMTTLPAPISAGFVQVSPQAVFPGAGGMPIRDAAGVVVGGIAASGATVSPFLPTGIAPEVVSADGEPANPEDLLIAYALGVPYVGQHGDDLARWQARFGDLVVAPQDSLGMVAAPSAGAQPGAALGAGQFCDRVLAAATARRRAGGLRGGGRSRGRPGAAGPDGRRAGRRGRGGGRLGCASTAARVGCASEEVAVRYARATAALGRMQHPAPFLPVPGGLPLIVDGRVVGGLGVGGLSPSVCAELAVQGAAE